jgi:aryl-alcohol dehydrogenase-like predicted oxidoreductase
VDPKLPVEEAIKTLAEFVKEGKFDYIGMSECSAETLRRANAVCLFLRALVPTNESHVCALETLGTPNRCSRDRGQPVVLRRRNEER